MIERIAAALDGDAVDVGEAGRPEIHLHRPEKFSGRLFEAVQVSLTSGIALGMCRIERHRARLRRLIVRVHESVAVEAAHAGHRRRFLRSAKLRSAVERG